MKRLPNADDMRAFLHAHEADDDVSRAIVAMAPSADGDFASLTDGEAKRIYDFIITSRLALIDAVLDSPIVSAAN